MIPGLQRRAVLRLVGITLAAPALIWLVSGIVLALLPGDLVRGERHVQTRIAPELVARSYSSPGGAIAQTPGVSDLRLTQFLDRVVYVAEGPAGRALFDARTGEKLSPITEKMARTVATRDYVGEGTLSSLALMTAPPGEFGGSEPVWLARFDDDDKTRLYVSPQSGEVALRRNRFSTMRDTVVQIHRFDFLAGGRAHPAPTLVLAALCLAYFGTIAAVLFNAWVVSRRRNAQPEPVTVMKEDEAGV